MKLLKEEEYDNFTNGMNHYQLEEVQCDFCNEVMVANDSYYKNEYSEIIMCEKCMDRHNEEHGF